MCNLLSLVSFTKQMHLPFIHAVTSMQRASSREMKTNCSIFHENRSVIVDENQSIVVIKRGDCDRLAKGDDDGFHGGGMGGSEKWLIWEIF